MSASFFCSMDNSVLMEGIFWVLFVLVIEEYIREILLLHLDENVVNCGGKVYYKP